MKRGMPPFIFFSELFQKILRRKDVQEGFAQLQHEIYAQEQTITQYNARSDGYIDVRSILKITPEQEKELLEHFSPFKDEDMDKMVVKVANHVNKIMTYTPDKLNFVKPEYWASPYDVFKSRKDDCDGYAALILKVWELLGVPADRRMIWTGDVFSPAGRYAGGHAVPVYLSYAYNEWFVMEGSYNAGLSLVAYRKKPLWENRLYGKSWFVFNEERSYLGTIFQGGA